MRSELDGSNFEVFATGIRNLQEFSFDDHGNLISVDNDGDHAGEKERLVYLPYGSDSGWRSNWQYGKYTDPKNNRYNVWMRESLFKPRAENTAAHVLAPIENWYAGPSGMVYNPGTALSDAWKNYFFVSSFPGAAPNARVYGFTLAPDGAGFKKAEEKVLTRGVLVVGMKFGPDGALYLTDWITGWDSKGNGRLWKLDTPATAGTAIRTEVQELLRADFAQRPGAAVSPLLRHADMRVRQKAQFDLVRRGDAQALLFAARDRSSLHAAIARHLGRGATRPPRVEAGQRSCRPSSPTTTPRFVRRPRASSATCGSPRRPTSCCPCCTTPSRASATSPPRRSVGSPIVRRPPPSSRCSRPTTGATHGCSTAPRQPWRRIGDTAALEALASHASSGVREQRRRRAASTAASRCRALPRRRGCVDRHRRRARHQRRRRHSRGDPAPRRAAGHGAGDQRTARATCAEREPAPRDRRSRGAGRGLRPQRGLVERPARGGHRRRWACGPNRRRWIGWTGTITATSPCQAPRHRQGHWRATAKAERRTPKGCASCWRAPVRPRRSPPRQRGPQGRVAMRRRHGRRSSDWSATPRRRA